VLANIKVDVKRYAPASIFSRQILFNWMDKYVNEREIVSLPANEDMAKKKP